MLLAVEDIEEEESADEDDLLAKLPTSDGDVIQPKKLKEKPALEEEFMKELDSALGITESAVESIALEDDVLRDGAEDIYQQKSKEMMGKRAGN